MVVGAVALIATGIGAAAGAGVLSLSAGAAATIATIATVASVAASVLSVAAALTAKKPTAQATGSPTQFTADPDAGIPLVVGRTGTAGNIVMRKAWDTRDAGDNDRQAFISILSLGPVAAIDSFTSDKAPVSFSAGAALGAFAGFMWLTTQLGATPEAAAMTFGAGAGTPPGWTAAHKLSGKAAAAWTLKFDTKGKVFQAGVPAPMWVVRGAKCYDPRKDSTYPGGSGSHRMADPADTAAYDAATDTWEFTEDPYLLGLHWAHGFWQRDRSDPTSKYQRVMGMGSPWAMIDVAAFVEGANVAQANGWKCGGVVYSGDDKWASMKKILQAGMGEPLPLGARISCLVNAPKVSLATITKDDLAGKASVATTQPRRNRLNTITPRYRLEANNWQLLPGSPVSVPEYVTLDKGKRSKTQDYPFIQDTKQVATAVRYDIENGREFGPITLPLKLVWMGYKPGDCVTVALPEVGLNDQPVLLLNRDLEPATGVVTMTARSETAAKHPYALGQTTTAPPTPGVTAPLLVPVPADGDWFLDVLPADVGVVSPTLVVLGHVFPNVDGVVFEYREFGSGGEWSNAGSDVPSVTRREITGVKADTQYEVAVSYVRNGIRGDARIIGPVTTPTVSVKGEDGADGISPPLITVTASQQAIRYNGADQIVSGDVTITTTRANTADTPKYTLVSYDGTDHLGSAMTAAAMAATWPTYFGSTGPDNLTIKQGWLNLVMQSYGGGLRVTVLAGGATDVVSLTKVKDGDDGADGAQGPKGDTGAQGPKGDTGATGAPGAPGRDAVVFQQNTTPVSPVVGDTWVTLNYPRVWKRWDGSSWVQILGDVAALSLIDSAYIADLAVGTGKFADLSVSTLKIADQAVTTPVAAYAPAAYDVKAAVAVNTWTTAHSVSIASSGAPISVLVSFALAYVSSSSYTTATVPSMRLLRDGVVIRGPDTFQISQFNNGLFTFMAASDQYISFSISDTPGAGTHTYTLQFLYSDSGCTVFQAANRQFNLLETKK